MESGQGEGGLSMKEVDRLEVIREVAAGRLKQREGAARLRIGVRQVKRLVRRLREEGAKGMRSRRQGRRAPNAIGPEVRGEMMAFLRERYEDFGPTLAHEKLSEVHGYGVSVETVRKWMMADGLWRGRKRSPARVHQSRPRRPALGELVQIDGSPHAWFEERGPRCTLIVFIDDATSRLMALRFAEAETTEAYMRTLRGYLDQHGRPVAVYSDKHSIFRVNQRDREGDVTQFTRVLKTLDIEPIHAHTPQAKGRVERANGTLQDRLVKELRLQGIQDMDSANAFLPEFMADYNRRFAVAPQSSCDAHRPVLHERAELDLIHSLHSERKLSRNLTLRYKNREYQIQGQGRGYRLRGSTVTVCEDFDGGISLRCQGKTLDYQVLAVGAATIPTDDEKSVWSTVEKARRRQRKRPRYKPAPDHPWNRWARLHSTPRAPHTQPSASP